MIKLPKYKIKKTISTKKSSIFGKKVNFNSHIKKNGKLNSNINVLKNKNLISKKNIARFAPPFKVLGLQQIALGGESKEKLSSLWVDEFGLEKIGSFKSESENVNEDILQIGKGLDAIEVDIMEPLDINKSPKVHKPALNHIGLWVNDLDLAYGYLSGAGYKFAGGIRKGAGGHNVAFIHPKAKEGTKDGCGVLIELVQAPTELIRSKLDIRPISVGQRLPNVTFKSDGKDVKVSEYFKDKKVLLVSVPAAFSGTCNQQVPTYVENLELLKSKGVDKVAITAVNDDFAMSAWKKDLGADGLDFLADGHSTFVTQVGLRLMMPAETNFGNRAQRYAMLVDDGEVVALNVEKPGEYKVSGAQHVLKTMPQLI